MRELKFRAWLVGNKKYDWQPIIDNGKLCTVDGNEIYGYEDENTYILEQYTGLEDRGKEIYEGDIIRWANSVGREITAPVAWDTRAWCWTAGDYMLGGLLEFDLEVVGNIHEDLKLLEAKE